jgi:hypothetical protein
MTHSSKLSRAALVSAIALCFGAPVQADDSAPIVVAQASGTGSQGGSNSMQPGGAGQAKHGTSSNTAAQPSPGATGAVTSGAPVTSGPAAGSNSANNARGAADNTNSRARTADDMNAWMSRHARDHKGRISREAYLDEMGRRWDAMDRNSQGLTPAEVSRLTGKVDVDHSAPPRTGSGAQAGNMGPSSTKGN